MYRINNEIKGTDEVKLFIATLTSGVTITDVPLRIEDRNYVVFSGTALLHGFLRFRKTTELDLHHLNEILAYDLIELDMTEERCFSERSLLWIRRIVDALSESRPVLIRLRKAEEINRNYEVFSTGLKHNTITIEE